MTLTLLQAATAEERLDIISLIFAASPVVKGVLLLLALMSVASWYVIGSKALYLGRALGPVQRVPGGVLEDAAAGRRLEDDRGDLALAGQRGVPRRLRRAGEAAPAAHRTGGAGRSRDPPGRPREHPARARPGPHHRRDRDGAPGAAAGHHRQRRPVHRSVRDRVGHHELVPQHRRQGRGQPGHGRPGHRRGAGGHGHRPGGRHPRGHGLQLLRRAGSGWCRRTWRRSPTTSSTSSAGGSSDGDVVEQQRRRRRWRRSTSRRWSTSCWCC